MRCRCFRHNRARGIARTLLIIDVAFAAIWTAMLASRTRVMDVCKSPRRTRTFLNDVIGFLERASASLTSRKMTGSKLVV
jgi:hypothetical protein